MLISLQRITAEINAYQRVAGEAIFEIGRRLYGVKYNPKKFGLPEGTDKDGQAIVARGDWGEWLDDMNIVPDVSQRLIKIYEELNDGKTVTSRFSSLGINALYEIAQIPSEQREQPHTIPSTGVEKTVDEMTVRELREVKAELKKTQEERDTERREREQAEQREKIARRDAEIARDTLEIDENENRQGFSFSEKMEWARRLDSDPTDFSILILFLEILLFVNVVA